MKMSRLGCTLLIAAWLTAGAWADVFVKNRPFKGGTTGKGAAVMVEAEPMLKSLGVEGYKLVDGTLTIGAKSLKTEGGMVSLKELTDAVGAKMVLNSAMGTIDVYQSTEKQAEVAAAPEAGKAKPSAAAAWGAPTWHTTWAAAASASKSSNKPILINFTGSDWCGWCMKLKKEVFDTDAFKAWASKKVVLLEVDFPRGKPQTPDVKAKNQELAQQFGVSGYPSIFFSNAQGKALGPRFGYAEGGPQVWTKQAEQIMGGR